jgi:hypothetical protein
MARIKLSLSRLIVSKETPRWNGKLLVTFGVFVLGVLLIGNPNQFAVEKAVQAGRRVELEQGKKARSSFTVGNHCSESHRLRVTSPNKFLHFEKPTDAVLIGPASNLQIGVVFDTTELEIGVYPGKLIVECLDCDKQARKCMQSPLELPFELMVVKSATKNKVATQATSEPEVECSTLCSPLKPFTYRPCTCVDRDGDT